MSDAVLSARGIGRTYRSGPRVIEVLRGLDLEVRLGETVAIVGDSGIGKSTLLHILGGLDRPDDGTLHFRGQDIFALDAERRADYRNEHVGFVFQMHHLLPEFTALENVELPMRIGRKPAGTGEARSLLKRLGMSERLHHAPGELSGGEQQRVAIARAVINQPALVLADEPTGNLDPATGGRVFDVLRELQRERSFALVLASHSERLARECDRIFRMEDGKLRGLGDSETREYFKGLGAGVE